MEKIKSYLKEFWLFLSSRVFLNNFAKIAGLVVALFLLTNWWLRCYTNHGESVQVDDFIGMHLTDAERRSSDKGFRFEILESTYVRGKPEGIIINHTPKPLSRVKEGRKIYVTVTGPPKTVKLPLLQESSYDFAQYSRKLSNRFSIESRVKERVYDRKQAENTILYFFYNGKKVTDSDLKRGFDVEEGSTLEFVVTEKRTNEMNIPDLMCMNYDAADFLVSTFNLNIGQIFEDETVTDVNTAYVYKQEPAYDPSGTIQMGGQINVWLTQVRPSGCSDENE